MIKKKENHLRVLFFSSLFETNIGNETYYTQEINSFIRKYPYVEFLIYTIDRRKNKITRYHKNVLWIERKNWKEFHFFKDMIKIFMKFKPDVIHSVYVVPSLIMGFFGKFFRVPSILHGRGMDMNYYPFYRLKSKILLKVASKINNKILTVSNAMRRDVLKFKIPIKKVITIYDGVDFVRFNPVNKKFYSNKRLEILHNGRFSPEKCHDIIIKVCKKLRDNNINFHLTLMGVGKLENQVRELIRRYDLHDFITFLGWIDHKKLPNYMINMDLFILPSLTEGLSISALEAMSMKLPMILTKVGGNPEIAQRVGCILIEKNNHEQLYNAILYYFNNPKDVERGGNINREFIINNFNWDTHSKKLYNLYLEFLNRKLK
ncbi:MAG: glycosyltransferase family 4 protein [Candidatus Lokiarchaeia archaeon]